MKQGGFTLLEILVVVTIMAMIGAMALGGIRMGSRVWDRTAQSATTGIEDHAVRRFLTGLLEGCAPVQLRDGTRTPPVRFDGDPQGLSCVTHLPSHLASPVEHVVDLRVADGVLHLRWAPVGETDVSSEPLIETLASAHFGYLSDGKLLDRWSGRAALPQAIRIDIAAPDPWPPLVISLHKAGRG